MSTLLQIDGLRFAYSKGNEILKGLSFTVKAAKKIALLGPNGSGKSTTFKIISTQLKGWSGTVNVGGHDLSKEPVEVRQLLGVCFQNASLDKLLSAQENLELQGRVLGLGAAFIRSEISDLAATLRVDYLSKRVSDLSGGQARRIEIMKAFLGAPKLLLLDEPTNGLDPQARRDFWRELTELSQKKGTTVIVTTHLIDEAEVCDELVFISDGVCVGHGEPKKLRDSLGYDILQVEAYGIEEKKSELKALLKPEEKFDFLNASLRVFTSRPAELFEILQKKWSQDIRRIEWAKPTLADVYFEKTGKNFS